MKRAVNTNQHRAHTKNKNLIQTHACNCLLHDLIGIHIYPTNILHPMIRAVGFYTLKSKRGEKSV